MNQNPFFLAEQICETEPILVRRLETLNTCCNLHILSNLRFGSLEIRDTLVARVTHIITEWLLLLLVELDIPTLPRVKWTGHSLGRGGASAAHAIGVSIAVIMAWGLWKSLASALL